MYNRKDESFGAVKLISEHLDVMSTNAEKG
jgi:hypothetical protein